MARRHLRLAKVALIILDASEGILAGDATIAGYAHEEGRAVIIVVNKWDAVKKEGKRKFLEDVRDEFKFLEYAEVAFVSAKERRGINALFPLIRKAYESFNKRISTGQLNSFPKTLHWEYDMKIYFAYVTQARHRDRRRLSCSPTRPEKCTFPRNVSS